MTRGTLIALAAIAVVPALTTAIVVNSNGDGAPVSEGSAKGSDTGATDKSKRWSALACGERNWREVNPGVNGLGFVNNRGRQRRT